MIKFISVLLLVANLAFPLQKREFYIPELFSGGQGYGIEKFGKEIYFIFSSWDNPKEDFVFLMFGQKKQNYFHGYIFQVFGQRIPTYPPYWCSNYYFYCYKREIKQNWKGWIDFRGHPRPFCGGEKIKIPCLILRGN